MMNNKERALTIALLLSLSAILLLIGLLQRRETLTGVIVMADKQSDKGSDKGGEKATATVETEKNNKSRDPNDSDSNSGGDKASASVSTNDKSDSRD